MGQWPPGAPVENASTSSSASRQGQDRDRTGTNILVCPPQPTREAKTAMAYSYTACLDPRIFGLGKQQARSHQVRVKSITDPERHVGTHCGRRSLDMVSRGQQLHSAKVSLKPLLPALAPARGTCWWQDH